MMKNHVFKPYVRSSEVGTHPFRDYEHGHTCPGQAPARRAAAVFKAALAESQARKKACEDKIMEAVTAYAEVDDNVKAMLAQLKQAESELAQFLKSAQEQGIRCGRPGK